MEVQYSKRATNSLLKVVAFLEETNTEGSGEKWLEKVKSQIRRVAKSRVKLAICKNPSLARFNYSCFTYNDWVIAYRITKTKFEVCRFILGARLA